MGRVQMARGTGMAEVRHLKKLYDLLGSDRLRAGVLQAAEALGMRKNVLRMDTNDVCNIECIMCENRPQKCTEEHMMPLPRFNALLERVGPAARLLYLSCSYEPLMTPGFIDYIASAKDRGIPFVSFATNGLLLDDTIMKFMVERPVDELVISMNGFARDDYHRIMFRSNFDAVTEKLARLRELKRSRNSAFPRLRVNTILMKTNLLRFDEAMAFVEEYGASTVQFRSFKVDERHNNNPGEIAKERLSRLAPAEIASFASHIREKVHELSRKGITVIVPREILEKGTISEAGDSSARGSCSIPFFSQWVDFKGNLRICCGEHEDSCIGNVIDDDPGEVRKKRDAFRAQALSGKCRKNCTMFINSSTMT
ncbi:MAG: radical SAM protein [Candidatus Eremiobacteraeota bacterium]|nr:radical SAM protein [Candidatus Eremiobacteraeota bacterium]